MERLQSQTASCQSHTTRQSVCQGRPHLEIKDLFGIFFFLPGPDRKNTRCGDGEWESHAQNKTIEAWYFRVLHFVRKPQADTTTRNNLCRSPVDLVLRHTFVAKQLLRMFVTYSSLKVVYLFIFVLIDALTDGGVECLYVHKFKYIYILSRPRGRREEQTSMPWQDNKFTQTVISKTIWQLVRAQTGSPLGLVLSGAWRLPSALLLHALVASWDVDWTLSNDS